MVTRSLNLSEIKNLYGSIKENLSEDLELVIVVKRRDIDISGKYVTIVTEDSNRFQARRTGILASKGNVLLLDADQIPQKALLEELQHCTYDAMVIPEKSLNRNFMGRLLDLQRAYFQEMANPNYDPKFPVVPRFYNGDIVRKTLYKMDDKIFKYGLSHEDSILYYEVYDQLNDIKVSRNYILDIDPSFVEYILKSMLYGKYKRDTVNSARIPFIYTKLVNEINQEFLRIRSFPILMISLLRAIPYFLGSVLAS